MIVFKLEQSEYIELNNLLKVTGLCATGGMANIAIAEGAVTVDGHQEIRKRCKIRPGQLVEFSGRKITVVSAP